MNIPISIHGLVRAEQRNITGTLTIRQRIKKHKYFAGYENQTALLIFSMRLSLFRSPFLCRRSMIVPFFMCERAFAVVLYPCSKQRGHNDEVPEKTDRHTHTHRTEIFLYVSAFSWSS